MPLWRGSQSPPPLPRQSSARPTAAAAAAAPRTSGSCLFTVRTVGSIHSVSVHVTVRRRRQQPYTITPLCALLLKNQDTHIHSTHYHIRTTPSARLYTFYMYTYARTKEFQIKLFFSHLKYTGKTYLQV